MTGPPEVSAHLPAEGSSAGAARRFLSATLSAWADDALTDVATLLVSELVGNVVLHAGGELDVVVRRLPTAVRVEVHDRSPRLPVRKHYSTTATTGRGLGLVEDLSRRWGVERGPGGKAVWFELDAAPIGASDWPMGAAV